MCKKMFNKRGAQKFILVDFGPAIQLTVKLTCASREESTPLTVPWWNVRSGGVSLVLLLLPAAQMRESLSPSSSIRTDVKSGLVALLIL